MDIHLQFFVASSSLPDPSIKQFSILHLYEPVENLRRCSPLGLGLIHLKPVTVIYLPLISIEDLPVNETFPWISALNTIFLFSSPLKSNIISSSV